MEKLDMTNLVFIGFVGMIDPCRPEVYDAIKQCRSAGIRPVMITGDHIDTAVAIGKDLGIIKEASEAMVGSELDSISDEDLIDVVNKCSVFARVQPEHKTRIVNAFKVQGLVTAMTGDGVNDAPSIKAADIGIGMGITGTDVTKGAADMVLADDNFATIVNAVEEGRKIYDNVRKVLQFQLSTNMAESVTLPPAKSILPSSATLKMQDLICPLINRSCPLFILTFDESIIPPYTLSVPYSNRIVFASISPLPVDPPASLSNRLSVA